ncbi:MAG: ATP-binding protein [Eubacteriales bacterium]
MEEIFKGGNSKSRNPRMQTMLRMIGFGDNAGSGFLAILAVWQEAGWETPVLEENTVLNQVTLTLQIKSTGNENFKVSDKVSDKMTNKQREFYNILVKVLGNDGEINTKVMVEQIGWGESTVRRYSINKDA